MKQASSRPLRRDRLRLPLAVAWVGESWMQQAPWHDDLAALACRVANIFVRFAISRRFEKTSVCTRASVDPSGLQGDRKISFVSYHTRATSINIVRARHACTTQPAKLARDLAYCAVCVFPPHNMRT